MSVLASKRKQSRFEVIVNAVSIHDMLLDLMAREFGLRKASSLVRKRNSAGCLTAKERGYYTLILNQSKSRIDYLCRQLISNIRAANSIYPVNDREYTSRREYQNCAIANCEQIIGELQRIIDIFDVDINLYIRYTDALTYEKKLIKSWRQSDNKRDCRISKG